MKFILYLFTYMPGEFLLMTWLIIMSIVLYLGYRVAFERMFIVLVVGVILFIINKFSE